MRMSNKGFKWWNLLLQKAEIWRSTFLCKGYFFVWYADEYLCIMRLVVANRCWINTLLSWCKITMLSSLTRDVYLVENVGGGCYDDRIVSQ